jgi:hypothetical protein
MGTWIETCAISNLPIPHGTAARLLLLVKSPDFSEGLHTGHHSGHALWTPWSLPLLGVYDGFGRITDTDPFASWHVDMLVQRLREDGVEKPPTKFEEPTRLADVSEQDAIAFIQALIHDGRLSVRATFDAEDVQPMGSCLIREDVYQTLASAPVVTDSAIHTAKDRIDRFRDYVREQKTQPLRTGQMNDVIAQFDGTEFGESLRKTLVNLADFRRLAEAAGSYGPPGYRGLGAYRLRIPELVMAGMAQDNPILDRACTEFGTFEHVLLHFEHLRRLWGPQNGAGSQLSGWGSHAILARHVAQVAFREFEAETGTYEDPTPMP